MNWVVCSSQDVFQAVCGRLDDEQSGGQGRPTSAAYLAAVCGGGGGGGGGNGNGNGSSSARAGECR
jgi:hypothetical protein